ncbi:MAG: hypothetical protein K2H96_00285 [Muribaculaceae bacterium]|nr:hypothetical protein [Muribaculaceae bacterium]
MKTLTTKEKISYGLAVGTMLCGLVLLFMSFVAPPEGEINSSVLYAFGEISLFVGSILGISVHVNALRGDFRSKIIVKDDLKIKEYEKDELKLKDYEKDR